MRYVTHIDVKGLPMGELPQVLDYLREMAFAKFNAESATIRVIYTVEPDDMVSDLMDLRGVIAEQEAYLSGYMPHPEIPKPQPLETEEAS